MTAAVNLDPPHTGEEGLREGLWVDGPVKESFPLSTGSLIHSCKLPLSWVGSQVTAQMWFFYL